MKRAIIYTSLALIILPAILLFACNAVVVHGAKGKVFDRIEDVAPAEYGLLLGTTPQARIGGNNYFFTYRIDATESLYKAGKITKILISGDENSLGGVDETQCMKDSLVAQQFHNERAVYLDEQLRLDYSTLQAYNAQSPRSKWAQITYCREYLARVKMFIDILKTQLNIAY